MLSAVRLPRLLSSRKNPSPFFFKDLSRKYGIALFNPQKPGRIFACELNFKPGEEIEDTRLVQIQTSIHDRWAAVQAEHNDRGGQRDSNPITVARAILEDFGPYLPR